VHPKANGQPALSSALNQKHKKYRKELIKQNRQAYSSEETFLTVIRGLVLGRRRVYVGKDL